MKKYNKDFEMLSAYLDGELFPDEVKIIEKKIALSKELQDKLEELKKIKQFTASSVKSIEPDSFFETRLTANLNSEESFKSKLKKWSPALGFGVLAIVIMLFLRFNPTVIEDLLKDQETNIAGFYKENLKPLLITARLTNEDIFNFAFSSELPLDEKKQKYIKLDSDENGNSFAIRTFSLDSNKATLEKFVQVLNLNEKEKRQMDSILNSYKDDLKTQVLVNNKNTIAVSPNIWNYHKAIFADLMTFAKNVNESEFKKIIPGGYSYYSQPVVNKMVSQIKSNPDSEYIFLTPDSIFTAHFKFDADKFETQMDKVEDELNKNLKDLEKNLDNIDITFKVDAFSKLKEDSSLSKNFHIYIDSNICRVEIPKIKIPNISLPDFDSISADINEALEHVRSFSFTIPKHEGGNFKFKFDNGDSVKSFNFAIPNIDSLIKYHTRDDSLYLNDGKIHVWGDSLSSAFKMFMSDSFLYNQKEFKEQMEQMQESMEKFREQMEEFQQEFEERHHENKREKEAPVEI